jgi:hypothetical protein
MSRLFRSVLAFFALGVGVIGCGKSDDPGSSASPQPSGDRAKEGGSSVVSEVVFHVPGMN